MSWARCARSSGSTLTRLLRKLLWRFSYMKEEYVSYDGVAFKRIELC